MRLLLALLLASPLAKASTPEAFISQLQQRLSSQSCNEIFVRRGDSVLKLKPHHLLDVAHTYSSQPNGLDEALEAITTSIKGMRSGGKTYPLYSFLMEPFSSMMHEYLQQEFAKLNQPSETPLYVSIVGLGSSASEVEVISELLDTILKKLSNSGDATKAAKWLNLRIGLYDIDFQALSSADFLAGQLEKKYRWLKGRTDVRFFDMGVPGLAITWTDRRVGIALARNSLRDYIKSAGWPFLVALEHLMPPGGLLVVDSQAKDAVLGHYDYRDKPDDSLDFSYIFYDTGAKFGLDGELDSFVLSRSKASR